MAIDDRTAPPAPHPSRRRAVAPDISRSWLLVSGTDADRFERAQRSRADQIILDIEDAVDPAAKPGARSTVAAWLAGGGEAWVRINDVTTDFWADDVEELRGLPGLQGVMLAKTESPAQVTDTWHRLGGHTPVIALVESALGIEEATSIAKAQGAFRLAFGSGDYRRDTGTSADTLAMAYPRSRLVVASRVGQLPGPIDGPTVGSAHAILRDEIDEQRRRKLALHASKSRFGVGLYAGGLPHRGWCPAARTSRLPSPACSTRRSSRRTTSAGSTRRSSTRTAPTGSGVPTSSISGRGRLRSAATCG